MVRFQISERNSFYEIQFQSLLLFGAQHDSFEGPVSGIAGGLTIRFIPYDPLRIPRLGKPLSLHHLEEPIHMLCPDLIKSACSYKIQWHAHIILPPSILSINLTLVMESDLEDSP